MRESSSRLTVKVEPHQPTTGAQWQKLFWHKNINIVNLFDSIQRHFNWLNKSSRRPLSPDAGAPICILFKVLLFIVWIPCTVHLKPVRRGWGEINHCSRDSENTLIIQPVTRARRLLENDRLIFFSEISKVMHLLTRRQLSVSTQKT